MHRPAILCLFALVGALGPAGALIAQGRHCDQDLNPAATNPLAYRLRGDRCEGVYIQDVAATALRVASFTESYESFDLAAGRPLLVEWTPQGTAVHIRAQSLRSRLYYRMDSDRSAGSGSFSWPMDLLAALRLEKPELGVLAWTTRRIGDADRTVFEPLRVRQIAAPTPGPYRLVVVPGVQLEEIFVSVAPLKSNGEPGPYAIDKQPAALGYYPAGRAAAIAVQAPVSRRSLSPRSRRHAHAGRHLRGDRILFTAVAQDA